MYTYKVFFLNRSNYPINHVFVQANDDRDAFNEAKKEYNNRKWHFRYYDLAGERI